MPATIRLLHRRRGWLWTLAGSVVGLLVTLGLLGALAPNASGGAGVAVASIFVLLLTITALVALVASIVDTVRLHRIDPDLRRRAGGGVAHHPVHAHPYRYPPRHRISWVLGWFLMVVWAGLGVAVLPAFVDGVAYLSGAESSATFVPVSHQQECGRGGCSTVTNGYLAFVGTAGGGTVGGGTAGGGSVGGAPAGGLAGGPSVIWPGQVPLGQPFTVRAPLWDWGFGSQLNDGDGSAIGAIVAGLAIDGGAGFVIFAFVKLTRNWLRHRRQAGLPELPGWPA